MTRHSGGPVLDFLDIDRDSPIPLYHQIYTELRRGILSGRLAAGTRLPSTRSIAAELGVSRRPLREAFDHLTAEGLLDARQGAGTMVRARADGRLPAAAAATTPAGPDDHAMIARLPARGRALTETTGFDTRSTGAFSPTLPAADQFPRAVFARLAARHWRMAAPHDFRKAPPAGHAGLRAALAEYLRTARGLVCTADQVLITAGGTHAIGLLARLLAAPGSRAWTENPGWPTGRQTLAAHQVQPVPLPVDGEGLVVEAGRRTAPDAALALVTPSRHYPLGMAMSLGRRLELLDWAHDQRSWIVEDDYDSEFQYTTRVLPPLQSLDRHGSVIYMGSLSKVLTQALRIGYLVVPQALAGPLGRALAHEKVVPTATQAMLARLIETGEFARHVRRMRHLYRRRQQALVDGLARRFGDRLPIATTDSGFHLLATLPDDPAGWPGGVALDEDETSRRLAELDIAAPTLGSYLHPGADRRACRRVLVLGFATLTDDELARGLDGLAAVIGGAG
ncbi:PLP-dependent aminotransferase family protein [Tistrella sp. BH-R2-4]|uniref:PLP-dependent aminotransferase family protein n=1 Tax=Tistrella arctica TaxID=3133430 RepID=A0ABU9YLN9_9PROT